MSKMADEWEEIPEEKDENEDTGSTIENPLRVYYDGRKGSFWRESEGGGYIVQKEAAVRRYLKTKGFSQKADEGEEISPIERAFEETERRFSVDYVGAVAGKRSGLHLMGNNRVLVTKSPALIKPSQGDWPHLKLFLETLLPEGQADWYMSWLSWAVKALHSNHYRAGQAVVIAGEKNCGKSLLACLVTEMLGGRSANPFAYLAGDSDFNSELAESEHLVIDDEASDTAPKVRKRLGAKLRGMVAARSQRIHPKGRAAVTLSPFWRITFLLNDDPSSLSVLPQMEDSLRDKITLLRARQGTLPVKANEENFEEKLWAAFTSELPAFIHYLINEHKIPEDKKDRRLGVKAYHEAGILELIEPNDEEELLALIEGNWLALVSSLVVEDDPTPSDYLGTARELESVLMREDAQIAKRVFYGGNVGGLLLGKLAEKYPHRVEKKPPYNGITRWLILPASD